MEAQRLPTSVRLGFSLGDHSNNLSLAALSLFYLYFLTEVAGLRPALAGLVLLIGRLVDAVSDPAMGRISDLSRWRWGRRRPYLLLGALPFGLSFALLWQPWPLANDTALFCAYAAAYVFHTLSSTVLVVPYMALLPEMALGYQERTAMNIYRTAAAMLGVLLAGAAIPPLVEWSGGGARGYAQTGIILGLWIALPWLAVYRVSWERPEFATPAVGSVWKALRESFAQRSYRHLLWLFLVARLALDIVGACLIFYVHYWLGRPEDFSATMIALLAAALLSLPLWLRLSRSVDKRTLFIAGAAWWIVAQSAMAALQPQWPRAWMFVVAGAAGIGYVIADLVPWAMLGDVIDEDELITGQRREGLYTGVFTFLRKLGGAVAVAVAGGVFDLAGFVHGAVQTPATLATIRWMTTVVPAAFLFVAIAIARSYPLSRERHAEIVALNRSRR